MEWKAGETLTQLGEGNGKYSCLFEYIVGDSPSEGNFGFYESFGEAAGILSSAIR
ncbi:hypothetical protein [Paenibacillus pseudetheri]|uniref:Uncharacterized protein n=1 Tax=Paenibacillus pseudetheri TaxID=2897682 RepID=A0ABN8FBT3_9BACL|nr:hypothetical protein [Paenibacillus pseudetheri]CAH1055513.1 hypothetical protein PAECIP111894_01665 [Paenibacillus pseudetheri]